MNEPISTNFDFRKLRTAVIQFATRKECLHRSNPPKAVVVMGGIGVGKTRYIRAKYSTGYIYLDAGEFFRIYEQGGHYPFPGPFVDELAMVGYDLACFIFRERYDFVVEFTGMDESWMRKVKDAIISIGYQFELEFVYQDIEKAIEWNFARGPENISAYHCEVFHQTWITEAPIRAIEEQENWWTDLPDSVEDYKGDEPKIN